MSDQPDKQQPQQPAKTPDKAENVKPAEDKSKAVNTDATVPSKAATESRPVTPATATPAEDKSPAKPVDSAALTAKPEAPAEEKPAAKPADSTPPASKPDDKTVESRKKLADDESSQETVKGTTLGPSLTKKLEVPPPLSPPLTVTATPAQPEEAAKSAVKPFEPAPAQGPSTAPLTDSQLSSLPAKPAATSAGQICPNCGHLNRPGILFCENCGTNLMTGKQPTVGTRDLQRDQQTAAQDGTKLLDTSESKAVDTAGSSTFTDMMILRIEIEGASTPMMVYPKQEIILGRRDPNTGAMPDVDLTAYAGYRMGVSRRHAAIRFQDRQLNVSDLGSSNGTFLNGTRLNAHRPYQLRDGDEVRLGQMQLRLFFQTNRK